MRIWAWVAAAACLAVGASVKGADAKARDEAMQKEYARFEGTWRIVSLLSEGNKGDPAFIRQSRLVLKGNHFTMTQGNITYKGTYKMDLEKSPKQIDITFTEGPEKGKVVHGIYTLEGDTYTLCLGLAGRERPIEFASRPGSGHALEVLQREKPPGERDAAKGARTLPHAPAKQDRP